MRFFRKAEIKDAAAIEALYREFMPYSKLSITPSQIAQITKEPHTHLIICEESNEILATALLNLCPDIMFGQQPFAVVDNLIVARHYQREGIGKSLIDHIEELCATANCSRILLNVAAERTQARDFLTAMGFDPDETLGFIKYRKYFTGTQL